jgi:hypothetical protein
VRGSAHRAMSVRRKCRDVWGNGVSNMG